MALGSPRSDATLRTFLGHLDRWCVAQIAKAGQERATVTVRATTLRALIRQARRAAAPEHANSHERTTNEITDPDAA